DLAWQQARRAGTRDQQHQAHYGRLRDSGELLWWRLNASAWNQRLDLRCEIGSLEADLGRQRGRLSRFRRRSQGWPDDSAARSHAQWQEDAAANGVEEHHAQRTGLELGNFL